MKRIITRMSLLAATAILATGCAPVRHNLPPEQRLLEPGPGVGGPGPGVLGPPAVNPGMGAMGPMMGGGGPMLGGAPMGGPGGPIAGGPAMGAPGITRTNYNGGCQSCNGPCSCGGNMGKALGFGGTGPGQQIPAGCGVISGMNMNMAPGVPPTVQVTFGNPDGMHVRYDATGAGMFDSEPLVVPARQNFPQGGLYRLKVTNIPNREGVELYPTVELAYGNPRTGAYLAHNSIPVELLEEDLDQILTGNFVTKVIYLPDPDFQGPALAGIDTLVSTRLEPGIDPIVEADRRGSILAIVRVGDKDVEMGGLGSGTVGGYGPPIAGLPAPFAPAMTEGCGGPGCGGAAGGGSGCGGGCCSGMGRGTACATTPPQLPGMIAGITAPQYGMPMSGTPIGLPGPPHIPLGHPAGLKKHVIRNHTPMHIPRPVDKMRIDVRQQPGQSYPNPVSRVKITEQNIHPGVPNARGVYQKASQRVDPNCLP